MSGSDQLDRLRRQLDLIPLDVLETPIVVIGAGGIGSFSVLALSLMGLSRITVWDHDVVESQNTASQCYRLEDVGQPKVLALARVVRSFAGASLDTREERFTAGRLDGIVIGAVDSMASRKAIWAAACRSPNVRLVIDARMGGLVSICRPVNPLSVGDARRYERTLHSDEEALQESCSARAIAFTTLAVASTLARIVRQELLGGSLPREVIQDHALGIQLVS